jgi:preprotein translocase subunit SecD
MGIKLTTRIIIVLICLFLAVLAINPVQSLEKGILIKNVKSDSIASSYGLSAGDIIKELNGASIKSVEDYSKIMSGLAVQPVEFVVVIDSGEFRYTSKTLDFDVDSNDSIISVFGNASSAGLKENHTVLKINNNPITKKEDFEEIKKRIEPKIKITLKTNKEEYAMLLSEPLDITVSEIPSSNLRLGLDLQGGTRGLIKPEKKLDSSEMSLLLAVSRERLNVYGLSDVNIREVTDLSGNNYMLVEVAGATPSELEELIGKQGKFEAKIGNETIFIGGKKDITSVCREDATCARIERCLPSGDGFFCEFSFSVYLSQGAAEKQANATANLEENISERGTRYLSKTLDLFLDDKLVDSLQISADLKGAATTQVAISGPGTGLTQAEAYENAQNSMAKLQTILITGSLPFKLEIEKLDSISPLIGKNVMPSIYLAAAAAFLVVALIIFIRYKQPSLIIPVILTMLSELILTLGVAALIRWNLDLASIAGIVAAIGTGVDDQVVIIDESRVSSEYSWRERVKRSFFIILGAFSTVVASLIPLWWAGAGLLKGFALTTMIGICIGVFITRPAFSDLIRNFIKK